MMGNPYGIDNAYIALAVPLVVMLVSHLFKGGAAEMQPAMASANRPASGDKG
jgi:SSS family solute:Na+ symporter